jgi:hypothetical protein
MYSASGIHEFVNSSPFDGLVDFEPPRTFFYSSMNQIECLFGETSRDCPSRLVIDSVVTLTTPGNIAQRF